MILSAGQAGDAPRAPDLRTGFRPKYVLANKAYDSNAIREGIAELGASTVIPCTATRKQPIDYDFEIHKERNRVERCFNKLKHFRRIATRYDRREIYFTCLRTHSLRNDMGAMNVDALNVDSA